MSRTIAIGTRWAAVITQNNLSVHDSMNATNVNGKAPINEDPYVIVAGELQGFAPLVLEEIAKLSGKMVIVSPTFVPKPDSSAVEGVVTTAGVRVFG
jgi:hypothetical protein